MRNRGLSFVGRAAAARHSNGQRRHMSCGHTTYGLSSKHRQKVQAAHPFFGFARGRDDLELVDQFADRHIGRSDQHADDRPLLRQTTPNESRNSSPIVSDQHKSMLRRPIENRVVGGRPQTDALNAKELNLRATTKETGDDGAVDVFVGQESNHPGWPFRRA
jgi:hypothetical protein